MGMRKILRPLVRVCIGVCSVFICIYLALLEINLVFHVLADNALFVLLLLQPDCRC
jgi:hypothetical protein